MVDDEGGALGHSPPIEELTFWLGATEISEGSERQTDVELTLVADTQACEGAADPLIAGVSVSQGPVEQLLRESCHVSTVADQSTPRNTMQNKQFTKVVIWIVVVGMVLSMAVTAIALFS